MAKKEKQVKLEDYADQFVPVFPTEKNTFHPQGEKVMVHPDVAKALIKKGLMTEEEPEGYESDDSDEKESSNAEE